MKRFLILISVAFSLVSQPAQAVGLIQFSESLDNALQLFVWYTMDANASLKLEALAAMSSPQKAEFSRQAQMFMSRLRPFQAVPEFTAAGSPKNLWTLNLLDHVRVEPGHIPLLEDRWNRWDGTLNLMVDEIGGRAKVTVSTHFSNLATNLKGAKPPQLQGYTFTNQSVKLAIDTVRMKDPMFLVPKQGQAALEAPRTPTVSEIYPNSEYTHEIKIYLDGEDTESVGRFIGHLFDRLVDGTSGH
ncbi:hypothetical protein K2X30_13435 [bacterium]|jgi:hypothetical protein|nr:hypothetical protein [bacterium]